MALGYSVESGVAKRGGAIEFSRVMGDDGQLKTKVRIVLDPNVLADQSDAVGVLLFELIRYKNFRQAIVLEQQLAAKTLTPEQFVVESEKITYQYMKDQQVMATAAAADWKLTTDRYAKILDKYKTFDDFLAYEKTEGHYQALLDQVKAKK